MSVGPDLDMQPWITGYLFSPARQLHPAPGGLDYPSLLGVSYSLLACALWPMVAFVVPEHQLGTAYGFMQSIQNLGLALTSMAAGSILDNKGYLFLEVFFSACVCLALIAVVMLYFVNYLRGGNLNLSASARAKLLKGSDSE